MGARAWRWSCRPRPRAVRGDAPRRQQASGEASRGARVSRDLRLGTALWSFGSFLPERLDVSEPRVDISFRYRAGLPASAAGPEEQAELEILSARLGDGTDVLATYCEDAELMRDWLSEALDECHEHLALSRERLEATREDAEELRREKARERGDKR